MIQIVEQLVRQKLNLNNITLKLMPTGTGRFSTTYFIETSPGHVDLVIRIAPPDDMLLLFYEKRMMRQEPALHRLIRKKTDIPIPTIITYDFSRSHIDRDYLIMNRMGGRSLSEMWIQLNQQQINCALKELGGYIAKLHTITADKYGYIGAHHPMEPQTNWHDAFALMWEMMLDDCVTCGIYSDQEKSLGMKIWQEYHHIFDFNTPATLCHMDLWIENVLVDNEGHVTCLFDFDRACFGDIENEFAVAEYCGLTTDAFWDGYGTRPRQTKEWAIRRWFYLLYEHQKYIVISVSERRNDINRAKRYAAECIHSMENFARTGIPQF